MPRPLRIEFKNAWYHVMNRGAGKRKIFKNDEQRKMFLEIISKAITLFDAELHAYCLMDNHYHLLIKTPRGNLARVMRHINGVYTQNFNRLTKTDGSLFRGRYKAIIVDGYSYLLQVSRYIHLNPVQAGIVNEAQQFLWSSYSHYLQPQKSSDWLTVKEILNMMGDEKNSKAYKSFVELGNDKTTMDFYTSSRPPVIFGEKIKKQDLLKKVEEKKLNACKTDFQRTQELPSLKNISSSCASYFKIDESELYVVKRGSVNIARNIAIYASRIWALEKLNHIAKMYGCKSPSSVGRMVKIVDKLISADRKIAKIVRELQKVIYTNNC